MSQKIVAKKEIVLSTLSKEEMNQVNGGGKLGFRIHISKDLKAMGAVAGGAAAAGSVALILWELSLAGPGGAVAAAALPTLAAGVVGYAIERNWETCDLVVPFSRDYVKDLYI